MTGEPMSILRLIRLHARLHSPIVSARSQYLNTNDPPTTARRHDISEISYLTDVPELRLHLRSHSDQSHYFSCIVSCEIGLGRVGIYT
jgi:hypothetical protein